MEMRGAGKVACCQFSLCDSVETRTVSLYKAKATLTRQLNGRTLCFIQINIFKFAKNMCFWLARGICFA